MPMPLQADKEITPGAEALDDAIHALAQPLTALMFVLDLGSCDPDPKVWHAALDDARTECLRAINALERVRSTAHPPKSAGELQ